MLFKYKRINHPINKFHAYIRHLVLEVWCRETRSFTSDLLLPEFATIVNAMPANYLLNPIKEIYNDLRTKPKQFKRLLHDGFRMNNNIESLCEGKVTPLHYSTLKTFDKNFANKLYKFFVVAYGLLDDQRVINKLEGINNHYKKFFSKENNTSVCPFCGISQMLNSQNSKREAYDHFFPKETYPFNSVNFDNLVPMCHTCNSKYKTRKDPINIKGGGERKKTFFPYSTGMPSIISVDFDFTTNDIQNLNFIDITVQITCNNSEEKVERWKEIFSIEERYKAICCEEAAYKGWLEEYRSLKACTNMSFDDYIRSKSINRHLNKKFLEAAYLKACRNVGVI